MFSVANRRRPFAIAACLPLLLLGAGGPTLTPANAAAPRPASAVRAAANEDSPVEAASTSRIAGVTLPDGTFRMVDAGAVQELNAQLEKVAEAADLLLGEKETLVWAGPTHKASRNDALKAAVIASLKKAGYEYETAAEKSEDGTKITFFAAKKKGSAKQGILGFWAARDDALLLAWGGVKPRKGPVTPPPPSGDTPRRPVAKPDAAMQKRMDAALGKAIEAGNVAEVRSLLERDANPNGKGLGDQTFLIRAVIKGSPEIVGALLDKGANPNLGDPRHLPLFLAALLGEVDILDLLLEAGADVDGVAPETGYTALHGAAIGNKPEAAEKLLAKGANVKKKDKNGKTARQAAETVRGSAVAEMIREAENK